MSKGNPRFLEIRNKDITALNLKKKHNSEEHALHAYSTIKELFTPETITSIKKHISGRANKKLTLMELATIFNRLEVPTPSKKAGSTWHATTVARVRKRILELESVDILNIEDVPE